MDKDLTAEQWKEAEALYRQGFKISVISRKFDNFSNERLRRILIPGYAEKRQEQINNRRRAIAGGAATLRKRRNEGNPTVAKIRQRKTDRENGTGVVPLTVAEPEVLADSLNLPIEALPTGGCKFATSSHSAPADGHRFCGAPQKYGRPYCAHHVGVASGGLPASKRRATA